VRSVQRLANDTVYSEPAGRVFGVPDLPIEAARSALAQR